MVEAAVSEQDIEAFAVRWSGGRRGRARQLSAVLVRALRPPARRTAPPSGGLPAANHYVFERAVSRGKAKVAPLRCGSTSTSASLLRRRAKPRRRAICSAPMSERPRGRLRGRALRSGVRFDHPKGFITNTAPFLPCRARDYSQLSTDQMAILEIKYRFRARKFGKGRIF